MRIINTLVKIVLLKSELQLSIYHEILKVNFKGKGYGA